MNTTTPQHYLPVREAWLDARQEEILDPAQRIVDPHHHLWERPGWRYLLHEFLEDLRSGHDVRATVYIQARSMHRADGPEAMRPVGETEFANGVAAMCASGGYGNVQVNAGIVGYADLTLGDAVRPVLEAHLRAGGDRFRGIRHIATWDEDAALLNPAYRPAEDMLGSEGFRAGFRHLGALGLSYDAWLYFPQIPRLTALARAFPETPIVLDHCGGILGDRALCRAAGREFRHLAAPHGGARRVPERDGEARRPGDAAAGLRPGGGRDRALFRDARRNAWRPWMEGAIELFGTARCMFESNFPVDKGGFGYAVGWNAFKRLAAGAGADDKADLFWRSAANFYRLPAIA